MVHITREFTILLLVSGVFTCIYTGLIIGGASIPDENTKVGMITAGVSGLIHCVVFYVLCISIFCMNDPYRFCGIRGTFILITTIGVLELCACAAFIIAGTLVGNPEKIALTVIGAMGIFHLVVFTIIGFCWFGAAIVRH